MSRPPADPTTFDPIEMEVFNSRLLSITEEVMQTIIKSSFSTSIKERRDASVALFDAGGRLICQALYIPMLLSGVMGGVQTLVKAMPGLTVAEGDIFICNDAYLAGGTHAPDISIITPIFITGRLEFFIGNICHHSDVGGIIPGSTDHTLPSVFAEGIRIPLLKLVDRGALNTALLDLIVQNTREPEERIKDLQVQLAANTRGKDALVALATASGLETVRRAVNDLLDYTERRMRGRIRHLPGGVYEGQAWTDDEGAPGPRLRIHLAIDIRDGHLELDFAGSDPQARGSINLPWYPLLAACFIGLNAIIDPEIPINDGMFRVASISAPPGSIVNPTFPAAIGNREFAAQRVIRAVFQAMSKALPEDRAIAASCDINTGMAFAGARRDGSPFVYVEAVAGGSGALFDRDGMHGSQVGITNSANTPSESLEIEFPLLVREYGLGPDTVGAGRTQGGAGIVRNIEALVEGITVSTRADGKLSPAPGIFGGEDGGRSNLQLLDPAGAVLREVDMYLVDHPLNKNEAVRLVTPGGAGFGDPHDRPGESIARDVRNGFITAPFAFEHYGWTEGGEA